jgi:hypothetical protein
VIISANIDQNSMTWVYTEMGAYDTGDIAFVQSRPWSLERQLYSRQRPPRGIGEEMIFIRDTESSGAESEANLLEISYCDDYVYGLGFQYASGFTRSIGLRLDQRSILRLQQGDKLVSMVVGFHYFKKRASRKPLRRLRGITYLAVRLV